MNMRRVHSRSPAISPPVIGCNSTQPDRAQSQKGALNGVQGERMALLWVRLSFIDTRICIKVAQQQQEAHITTASSL